MFTDGSRGYDPLEALGFRHARVIHSVGEYVRGHVSTILAALSVASSHMESGGDGYLMVDVLSGGYTPVAQRVTFPLWEILNHLAAASVSSPDIDAC